MIKPFTCICLALAAGSGLYLYQVKQRAFALDASLRSTFHDIDVAREKTRMLRADWALMNDPERLQALASQYLTLKPMGPSQLVTLDQLAASLPAPLPPGSQIVPPASDVTAPVPVVDPTHGVPMASNAAPTPSGDNADGTAVAMLQPTVPSAPAAADADTVDNTAVPVSSAAPSSEATLKAAAAASVAASAAAAIIAPAPHMQAPVLPKVAAVVPHVAHRAPKHIQPAVVRSEVAQASGTGATLADAGTPAPQPRTTHHAATHHAKPAAPAGTQFFAANDATRPAYGSDRITPRAATVMYTPPSGSSLGMASSASLAPPRPLYSSTQ